MPWSGVVRRQGLEPRTRGFRGQSAGWDCMVRRAGSRASSSSRWARLVSVAVSVAVFADDSQIPEFGDCAWDGVATGWSRLWEQIFRLPVSLGGRIPSASRDTASRTPIGGGETWPLRIDCRPRRHIRRQDMLRSGVSGSCAQSMCPHRSAHSRVAPKTILVRSLSGDRVRQIGLLVRLHLASSVVGFRIFEPRSVKMTRRPSWWRGSPKPDDARAALEDWRSGRYSSIIQPQ
jgi:hypothetical protein